MKKMLALLLAVMFVLSLAALSGCTDPLRAKIDRMGAIYQTLGDHFYRVYEACVFDGSAAEDAAVAEQLQTWKSQIKQAKNDLAKYLDYSEEEIDAFIENWTALADAMDAMYEEHKDDILEAKAWIEEMKK